jgi:hypothetical protein
MSIEQDLEPLIATLRADGYDAVVDASSQVIVFTILAGSDSCQECLSPREVMEPIIYNVLRESGHDQVLELNYPSDP